MKEQKKSPEMNKIKWRQASYQTTYFKTKIIIIIFKELRGTVDKLSENLKR